MKKLVLYTGFFLYLSMLLSCKEQIKESRSNFLVQPGDIIVTNSGNDSVSLLSSAGFYKSTLYSVKANLENIYGVGWKHDTNEILISVDGYDRVMAISAYDGTVRVFVQNTQLDGTLRGVDQLKNGDVVVIESNNIERFTTNGVRITSGWPKVTIMNTPEDLHALSVSGFVLCSRGTDAIRTYDDDGTQVATVSSGIGGTTDGYGCTELSDGTIAGTWSGTADTVSFYDSSLVSTGVTYSDILTAPSPRGIAQLANGNVVVADVSYHYLVEINPVDGSYVGSLGTAGLSTPQQLYVIPDYL